MVVIHRPVHSMADRLVFHQSGIEWLEVRADKRRIVDTLIEPASIVLDSQDHRNPVINVGN
jgi:hypothetical protein